jgi:hypothetical protein
MRAKLILSNSKHSVMKRLSTLSTAESLILWDSILLISPKALSLLARPG